MTWLKVDDKMGSHPKVLSIPRGQRLAVMGLWLTGAQWCAGQLTDGVLPLYMLAELGASRKHAQALVDAGLWEDKGANGWAYHDWSDYQPTREQVENERVAARERMAKLRAGSSSVRANKERSSKSVRDSRPDPTQPTPALPPEVLSSGGAADTAEPPGKTLATTEPNAATLVAEWIDHLPGGRPGGSVVGQVSKRIGALLADGVPYADVRRGLAHWQSRGLAPSMLDSAVHEVRTASTRQTRPRAGDIDLEAARARARARMEATA